MGGYLYPDASLRVLSCVVKYTLALCLQYITQSGLHSSKMQMTYNCLREIEFVLRLALGLIHIELVFYLLFSRVRIFITLYHLFHRQRR